MSEILQKIYLSPDQIYKAYDMVLNQLKKGSILFRNTELHFNLDKLDYIVAPIRGGLWIGEKLSKEFGVPAVPIKLSVKRQEFEKKLSMFKDKNILFCDDIFDRGLVSRWFINNMPFKNATFAFLFNKAFYDIALCNNNADVFYPKINGVYCQPQNYLVFPWEAEFNEIIEDKPEFLSLRTGFSKT